MKKIKQDVPEVYLNYENSYEGRGRNDNKEMSRSTLQVTERFSSVSPHFSGRKPCGWLWSSHLSSLSINLTRGLVARRLFKVPPCREGTIYLQTPMSTPGFEPCPNGTAVSVANHYTGWATMPLRHGGTLNSRRAASSFTSLVEGAEWSEGPDHLQDGIPQNWIGTEPKRTIICMVLKVTKNFTNCYCL
ncbi:hypothetical protein TNCV_4482211 [Trichonephila clavipes]|nr:hypothetical protein TNCV_4482211 [Trichonephila clavipes]